MFAAATGERFAFESQLAADLSWMLTTGSLPAIRAMGYHLASPGLGRCCGRRCRRYQGQAEWS
jgi:hypothetical protein